MTWKMWPMWLLLACIGLGLMLFFRTDDKLRADCASIGAELRRGRDFAACAKPDGSLWAVPAKKD